MIAALSPDTQFDDPEPTPREDGSTTVGIKDFSNDFIGDIWDSRLLTSVDDCAPSRQR
ncbi:hypothetical protein FB45DRAFT_1039329 [Roridomyces roridus]|uniref:Uncharacterized protein n=1 Tax=Roridomyces roridus TaxID=1738132 RepID=A0AAD7B365_9AGAR|nr:hypothetical protein FB45DRAFT_1039329 [Roridomyces roridus]